jgi:hypothetical protein
MTCATQKGDVATTSLLENRLPLCVRQVCPMGTCMTVEVSMSNESTEAMNEMGDAK